MHMHSDICYLNLVSDNKLNNFMQTSLQQMHTTYVRGLFGKFVEFGNKIFKYKYNPFILWNLTDGHLWISIP